mgnify:FL=1
MCIRDRTKVTNAQTSVDQANQAQSAAQQNVNTATQAQAAAQKALDDAQANQENANQIHMSQDYIDALNAYSQASPNDSNYQQILDTLLAVTKNEWSQNGGYVSNSSDQAIKINSKSDLDKYMAELNAYAQQLINNVRNQFGTEQVQVSNGSKQVGQQIGDAYTSENHENSAGHDIATNNTIAKDNGLSQLSDQDMTTVMSKVLGNSWNMTLDDFKKALYEAMKSYLFNGNEWDLSLIHISEPTRP